MRRPRLERRAQASAGGVLRRTRRSACRAVPVAAEDRLGLIPQNSTRRPSANTRSIVWPTARPRSAYAVPRYPAPAIEHALLLELALTEQPMFSSRKSRIVHDES